MTRLTLYTLALLFSTAVFAADDQKLSVEQVLQINSALGQLNCGNKIIKDGTKETLVCENYKWTPGLTWLIASNQKKTQDIASQYFKLRNQAISNMQRTNEGKVSPEAEAQFAVRDREQLEIKTDVVLDHFKRSDLEPMGLSPSIISALLPIID